MWHWSKWCDTRRRKGESTGNTNLDLNRRVSPRPAQQFFKRVARFTCRFDNGAQHQCAVFDFYFGTLAVACFAWLRLGETIADVLKWTGADVPPLSLDCRHGSEKVQVKLYDRDKLRKRMEEIEG